VRVLKSLSVAGIAVLIAVIAPMASASAEVSISCDSTPAYPHCYAIRTVGLSSSAVPTGALSSVSSATGWVRADCQDTTYANEISTSEIWLITPNHSGFSLGSEWVEVGITSGPFSGTSGTFLDFYWARGYHVAGSQTDYYNEYLTTDDSFGATLGTNYIFSVKYVSGSWRIYHGTNLVGSGTGTNLAPGSNQAVQSGAESASTNTGNSGAVSHLGYVTNGTTVTGLSGYIFRSVQAYTYSSGSTQDLTFSTPVTPDGYCH